MIGDKAKGIISKPMPRRWYDFHANKLGDHPAEEDIRKREFNLRILAEKKPYFMCYIYSTLRSEYNTFIRNTNIKCVREFRMDLSELLEKSPEERTQDQNDFVRYYESRMPVSMNNCVMNRICRRFEAEFDGYFKTRTPKTEFDSSILKSDAEYTKTQYNTVAGLYAQYTERLEMYKQMQRRSKFDENNVANRESLERVFTDETLRVCSNSDQLCNIVVDLCYGNAGTKQFAWDICSETMLMNLLRRNDFMISFPALDPDGDISYNGQMFSMRRKVSKYGGDSSERETVGGGCDCERQTGDEAI